MKLSVALSSVLVLVFASLVQAQYARGPTPLYYAPAPVGPIQTPPAGALPVARAEQQAQAQSGQMKHVFSKRHGHKVAVGGRHRPANPVPYKHLKQYLAAGTALPTPPLAIDYSPAADSSLKNIYGNDTLGDCVIAAGYHDDGVWTGNAGQVFIASSNQIVSDYSAIGGYVPGEPNTDRGCDETQAFSYWTSHGFADGSKLAGVIQVDASNQLLLKQAIDLFESVYLVVELPYAWVSPFPEADNFVWDVAGPPNPSNGHAIMAYGYDASGLYIDTWGLKGHLTWAALSKYFVTSSGGNAYILISQAMLSKASGKNPAGLDWTAIATDFNSLGGNVPVPSPPPAPAPVPPNPVPVPPVPPVPVPPTPTPTPTPPQKVSMINVDTINRIINIASPMPIVPSGNGTVIVDPHHGVVRVPPGYTIKRWPTKKAG